MSKPRNTFQRRLILKILGEASGPLSMRDLQARMQNEIGPVVYSTVFRSLKSMEETGMVKAIGIRDCTDVYELTEQYTRHYFHCRTCGTVLRVPASIGIPDSTELQGNLVEDFTAVYFGTCRTCRLDAEAG
jgi:Fur family ferric uptake transcriptional regulator